VIQGLVNYGTQEMPKHVADCVFIVFTFQRTGFY